MKVDPEKFSKQLESLTEQAYEAGWKQKDFSKAIVDRIGVAWFNKQMTESQAHLLSGMEPQPNEPTA